MFQTKKTKVLRSIAKEFNQAGIRWALGGSMLLYFKEIANNVHDIDIMVFEDDVPKVVAAMKKLQAKPMPANPNSKYKTKWFLEYVLSGVDIDIMAGFAIVSHDRVVDCSFKPSQVMERFDLDGVAIPLQSVELWLKYYRLMGRDDKVDMIENSQKQSGQISHQD